MSDSYPISSDVIVVQADIQFTWVPGPGVAQLLEVLTLLD